SCAMHPTCRASTSCSPRCPKPSADAWLWQARSMPDEGLPIAYEALEENTAVYGSDGLVVGVVARVLAEPQLDIFHGIMIRTEHGPRFVAADLIGRLHELGVDLKIES